MFIENYLNLNFIQNYFPTGTLPSMKTPEECSEPKTVETETPFDSNTQVDSDSWISENKTEDGKQQRIRNRERNKEHQIKSRTWGSNEEEEGT